tara:strand:+ start:795 stop:1040 length:246 start_codon:yes stop_codon:yes gene_type:complete
MNAEIKAIWLSNLEQIARGTLSKIDRKLEESGGVLTEDHEVMSSLCMGYLYLLMLCEEQDLLSFDDDNPIIKLINKQETIH